MDVRSLPAAGYVPDAHLDGVFADSARAAVAAVYSRYAAEVGRTPDSGAGTGRLPEPGPPRSRTTNMRRVACHPLFIVDRIIPPCRSAACPRTPMS